VAKSSWAFAAAATGQVLIECEIDFYYCGSPKESQEDRGIVANKQRMQH